MKKFFLAFAAVLTAARAFAVPGEIKIESSPPGLSEASVSSDQLYEYVVTSPVDGDDQFFEFEIEFPNIKEFEWTVASSQRKDFYIINIDGSSYTHEYLFCYAYSNVVGANLGGPVFSTKQNCTLTILPGAFNVTDINGDKHGTNPEITIVVNKGINADELDFTFNYESPDSEYNNLSPELSEVNVTFAKLDKVNVDVANILVSLNDSPLNNSDYKASATCEDNSIKLCFDPAIVSESADCDLNIVMPAGSLTGEKGNITASNQQPVELKYTIVPPVVYDLDLSLYSPSPDDKGEISADKSFAMTIFACDVPDLKALPNTDVINVTIKELNGDFEDSGHLKIVTGMITGKSTFYVEFTKRPVYNGDYIITIDEGAFGDKRWYSDRSIGRSNATLTIPFKLVGGEDRKQTPSVELSLANVTTKIAGIKGVPSDDNIYWYANIAKKSDYPGPSVWIDLVENFFKVGAAAFNMDWIVIYQMTTKTGEYTWWYGDLEPSTEYVCYAFGLDNDGELYIPVTTIEFRTPDAIVSDNKFELDILSVDPGSDGVNKNVTVKVTTSNDDPYTVVCVDKFYADRYEDLIPGSDAEKNYMREILEPLVKDFGIHNGDKTLTLENVNVNSVMNMAVFGYEYDPTTSLLQKEFNTIDNELVAVNVEVYDPTITDASATLYAFDLKRPFIWGVVSKESAESIGGIQNVHEEINKPRWTQAGYGVYPWQQMAVQDLTYNAVDGKITTNAQRSALRWDTDYYIYAYTMDAGGYRTSPVFCDEFTTKSRNTGSIDFELNITDIKQNEANPDTYSVFMEIKPSEDETPYALYYGYAYDFEEYRDRGNIDDWLYSVFMSKKQKKLYNSYLDFGYGSVYSGEKYILIATGFDEAPTTDPAWLLFTSEGVYDRSVGADVTTCDKLRVYGGNGQITIDGDFIYANVFTAEGRQAGVFKGNVCNVGNAGFYIVKVRTAKGYESHKIMIK